MGLAFVSLAERHPVNTKQVSDSERGLVTIDLETRKVLREWKNKHKTVCGGALNLTQRETRGTPPVCGGVGAGENAAVTASQRVTLSPCPRPPQYGLPRGREGHRAVGSSAHWWQPQPWDQRRSFALGLYLPEQG